MRHLKYWFNWKNLRGHWQRQTHHWKNMIKYFPHKMIYRSYISFAKFGEELRKSNILYFPETLMIRTWNNNLLVCTVQGVLKGLNIFCSFIMYVSFRVFYRVFSQWIRQCVCFCKGCVISHRHMLLSLNIRLQAVFVYRNHMAQSYNLKQEKTLWHRGL